MRQLGCGLLCAKIWGFEAWTEGSRGAFLRDLPVLLESWQVLKNLWFPPLFLLREILQQTSWVFTSNSRGVKFLIQVWDMRVCLNIGHPQVWMVNPIVFHLKWQFLRDRPEKNPFSDP
jgi:hypothetical protein